MTRIVAISLLAVPVLACASAPLVRPEVDRDTLLATDAKFDADVAARGIEAWLSWFAPTTSIWDKDKLVHDRELYRIKMAPVFAKPGSALRWQPYEADASGDLGYTTGRWQMHALAADGTDKVVGTGKYCTVWRRQTDGSWKAVFDMGNDDR